MDMYRKSLKENLKLGISPGDDIQSDFLVRRIFLYYYAGLGGTDSIKLRGIPSVELLLKDYPDQKNSIIQKMGWDVIKHPIKRQCVYAFISRIPTLPSTQEFLRSNVPIRISVSKLERSHDTFRFYAYNFPKQNGGMTLLDVDHVEKLTTYEDKWYQFFKNSKHPFYMDVPQIAIWCESKFIPAFACKLLNEEEEDG